MHIIYNHSSFSEKNGIIILICISQYFFKGTVSEARKDLAMKEMTSLADLEGLRDSLDARADKQVHYYSQIFYLIRFLAVILRISAYRIHVAKAI